MCIQLEVQDYSTLFSVLRSTMKIAPNFNHTDLSAQVFVMVKRTDNKDNSMHIDRDNADIGYGFDSRSGRGLSCPRPCMRFILIVRLC